jgi:hypothetical protein
MKLAQPPLPPSGAGAHFADGLFAWWLLRRAASDAAGPLPEERDDAAQRWEDEGGNIRLEN